MKNISLITLICILSLALPAFGATVTIGNYTVGYNGSVIAPLIASGVTDLGAVTVDLSFNPAVVHVTSVAAGTGNALTFGLISNIDNSKGFATISSGSLTGLSGDVIIANFALDAVGSRGTSSPLNIAINLFADASHGNDIPVTPINGSFIITASGTPPGNSGGGGSGGASGEKTSNIEVIEKYDLHISKDVLTSYRFNDVPVHS